MSDTIAYDLPLVDLIDQMNATNHVTHTSYAKTSVTLHHNAGINTFQDVLNNWKTQQSSAHFDVDAEGNACQFVKTNEYAWAVGSHEGNCDSISIEQCNSGIGGDWPVSETTWHAACRLAAWLHIHVIGHRPTTDSLKPHQFWSPTACPGPYLMGIWSQVLAYCQAQYDELVAGKPAGNPVPSPTQPDELLVDGELGDKTISRWQQIMKTPVDGVISQPKSDLTEAVQKELNAKINAGLTEDGEGIIQDGKTESHTTKALQQYLGTAQDSVISTPVSAVVRALQTRLNTGSF